MLAATEKLTVPLPLPDAPPVIVIHDEAFDVAVHAHPLLTVTAMLPLVVPVAGTSVEVGEILKLQPLA